MPPDGSPDFIYVSKLKGLSGFCFSHVSWIFIFGLSDPELAVFPYLAMWTSFLLSLLVLFFCWHDIQSEIYFILALILDVKVYHLALKRVEKHVNKCTCLHIIWMLYLRHNLDYFPSFILRPVNIFTYIYPYSCTDKTFFGSGLSDNKACLGTVRTSLRLVSH